MIARSIPEYGSFEYTLNASDLRRRVVQRVKR